VLFDADTQRVVGMHRNEERILDKIAVFYRFYYTCRQDEIFYFSDMKTHFSMD